MINGEEEHEKLMVDLGDERGMEKQRKEKRKKIVKSYSSGRRRETKQNRTKKKSYRY